MKLVRRAVLFWDNHPGICPAPPGEAQLEGVCRLVMRSPEKHTLTAVPLFCCDRLQRHKWLYGGQSVAPSQAHAALSSGRGGKTWPCVWREWAHRRRGGQSWKYRAGCRENSLRDRQDFPGSGSCRGTSSTWSSSTKYITKIDAADQLTKAKVVAFMCVQLEGRDLKGKDKEETKKSCRKMKLWFCSLSASLATGKHFTPFKGLIPNQGPPTTINDSRATKAKASVSHFGRAGRKERSRTLNIRCSYHWMDRSWMQNM